jgi:hypothetical protein
VLSRIKRLPSPALVISAIALIVAVGGGTFAIAALSRPKIKNIARRQANVQIKKRAPGLSVLHAQTADTATNANHATSADTATTADNAKTTDAVTSFTYAGANGDVNKTVLNNFHGLTLLASCTAGANNGLTVRATSATPNAAIAMSGISEGGPPGGTASNDSFGQISGTPQVLTSPTSTVKTTNGSVNVGFASGQFVYSQPNGGSRVSVQWFYEGGLGAPAGTTCYWSGTATGTDNGPADVGKRTAVSTRASSVSSAQRARRASH